MPLNPIEEAKFEALRKNCKELGIPSPPEIHINFEVRDKNGNLIFEDLQRGHSWTRNFYNLMIGVAADSPGGGSNNFGAGYLSGKLSAGTLTYSNSQGINRNSFNLLSYGALGLVADAYSGIVVGTGDTAFSVDQYALVTPIAHGATSGTFNYLAQTYPVLTYDNSAGAEKWTVTHTRIFNNNSGGSITVKEAGILSRYGIFATNSNGFYLLERSVLSPTVAVPNGAQLTVAYAISMDFSAID